MKAVVFEKYGPPEVLRLREIARPVPEKRELLVRVKATTVNYGDLLARNFGNLRYRDFNMPLLFFLIMKVLFGLRKPRRKIPGSEFSGVVEALGPGVTRFRAGDEIFGYLGPGMGACAGYLTVPEKGVLAPKPQNFTFEEAAALPYGAVMAWGLLRGIPLREGSRVLVIGASGGIGAVALQIAKHSGAAVSGVCSASGIEYVKKIGAPDVFDYQKENYASGENRYDLILDIPGKSSFRKVKAILAPRGIYLRASFKLRHLLQAFWTGLRRGKRVVCKLAPGSAADLLAVRELAEAGKIRIPVGRTFPLEEAAAAHRYCESGDRAGKVVLTV